MRKNNNGEFQIDVKTKEVFKGSSEYLPDVEFDYFIRSEEKSQISEDDFRCLRFHGDDVYQLDARIIPLQDLKTLIEKAENSGANFVVVDYHVDHFDYNIIGFEITRMDEKEILVAESLEKAREEKNKQEQIKKLEEQMKKLKGE